MWATPAMIAWVLHIESVNLFIHVCTHVVHLWKAPYPVVMRALAAKWVSSLLYFSNGRNVRDAEDVATATRRTYVVVHGQSEYTMLLYSLGAEE